MSTIHTARAITRLTSGLHQACVQAYRASSTQSAKKDEATDNSKEANQSSAPKRKKTMKEIDDEIRAAMEGRSGDGGISGAELEGGKAVAMKRGVRDNMFRYI